MTGPNEKSHHAAGYSRLAGRMLIAATLAWGAALAACVSDQPMSPARSAPDAPSLALNPACDPGLGGTTHVDSVIAAETWSRANNPHRVNKFIRIVGAGVLTLEPGVLVCFGAGGAFTATNGGRLVANGLDTARIVLTAADPAVTWRGMFLSGTPPAASSLKHVRVEHTFGLALATSDDHAAHIDSSVFRQVGNGLHLWGRGSAIRHSRVDTVIGAGSAGVSLGTLTTWERNVIRGAAHVGLSVLGTYGVTLLGGRIEGSGTLGLWVTTTGPGFLDTEPVRVVGGAGYPAEMVVSSFPRIYPTLADQDSLLGNARDTLVVSGGILQAFAYPTQALPWRVKGDITVQYYGILHAKPGASLGFAPGAGITARNGGRVVARGTAAAPVRFAAYGLGGFNWDGITFEGTPALGSYLTNVRIEHATSAVMTVSTHPVVVDSSVIRQSGTAAWLAEGSRISRSRVDSTTASGEPAVVLSGNAYMESTLIRGAAKQGVYMNSPTATILSCEVRGSADAGIELLVVAAVHDCNLVDNGGPGIRNLDTATADAENNWWGDAAGPAGTNGDGVSGAVDYTPWRTTPYVLPYVP